MKTINILKRIYYSLTSGLLLMAVILLLSLGTISFYTIHPIKTSAVITVFTMLYCWVMSKHNNKYDGLLFCSIIALVAIGAIIRDLIYLKLITVYVCGACIMVVGFRSNTKYHNILPNQSKTVSKVFRILSWIGQGLLWISAMLFVILLIIYK